MSASSVNDGLSNSNPNEKGGNAPKFLSTTNQTPKNQDNVAIGLDYSKAQVKAGTVQWN